MALLAITLDFLQPLAHAARLRDGAPDTWAAMCRSSAQQDDQQSTPANKRHECCLGLGHAPALAEPSAAFVAVDRPVIAAWSLELAPPLVAVGIRDGPGQPRAPPLSL